MNHIKNSKQNEALKENRYFKKKATRIANRENSSKKVESASRCEEHTKRELYEQAKKLRIDKCCNMDKSQLIKSLRDQ